MKNITTYRDVIGLWRSRATLARLVGTTAGAVRSWWSLDFIPEKKFFAVAEAAEKCGFSGVTYQVLTDLKRGAAINPKTENTPDGDQD